MPAHCLQAKTLTLSWARNSILLAAGTWLCMLWRVVFGAWLPNTWLQISTLNVLQRLPDGSGLLAFDTQGLQLQSRSAVVLLWQW